MRCRLAFRPSNYILSFELNRLLVEKQMKKLVLLLVMLANISFVHASDNPLAITGIWHTGDSNTLVEIVTNKDPIIGKLIKSDKVKAKIGILILSEFKQQKSHWQAKIYAVKRDKYYPVEITRQDNTLLLKVDVGFFTKKIEWQLSHDTSS